LSITNQQRQIASLINDRVVSIITTKKTSTAEDEAIVELMPDWMEGFKILMDTLPTQEFNLLCEEYPGFFRFSKMLEKIAQGCSDGVFNDILEK
jgi:hypothetical protein